MLSSLEARIDWGDLMRAFICRLSDPFSIEDAAESYQINSIFLMPFDCKQNALLPYQGGLTYKPKAAESILNRIGKKAGTVSNRISELYSLKQKTKECHS